MNTSSQRLVLHVGCGPRRASKLHPAFQDAGWSEIRLDIDARVEPDVVASMVDMRAAVADGGVDAIWSSHNIEHLHAHEARQALAEFRRVLRPDGFALITCPDVVAIAQLIVDGRFDQPVYNSPAGPISPLDMLWGHRSAIAAGNAHMAHRMGFSRESLGYALAEAGFAEAWCYRGDGYDLWAVGFMRGADRVAIHRNLEKAGLRFSDPCKAVA
jgi:predicted SAM-dependent methyltransferase